MRRVTPNAKRGTIRLAQKTNQEQVMVYRGHVRNGKIEIDEDARLPEGAEVDVTLRHVGDRRSEPVPTVYEQLEDIIGTVPDLPEDLSVNHDHYLYGVPKRE